MAANDKTAVAEPGDVVKNFLGGLRDKTLCDIVLVAGSYEVPCHRFVLCVTSNVFKVMLTHDCWPESSSHRVVLHEPEECNEVFESFIHYMYSGEIEITVKSVLPQLLLADKYNLPKLVSYCTKFMMNNFVDAVKENCIFSWLKYASGDMHQKITLFVRLNFEFVANNTHWAPVDMDTFCSFISDSNIVITNEYLVFRIAESWLLDYLMSNETDEQETSRIVLTVLGYVRYPMMSSRHLGALAISKFAQKYNEFIVNRMALGINFQLGFLTSDDLRKEPLGFTLIYPRIYTEESLSSQVTVESYRTIKRNHNLTMVFSTNTSCAEHHGEKIFEWILELWLKGVKIDKCVLLPCPGVMFQRYESLHLPGLKRLCTRLSLTCKDIPKDENFRARVGILESPFLYKKILNICALIHGTQNSENYVSEYKETRHIFKEANTVVHINDVVPYTSHFHKRVIPELEGYFVGEQRDSISMRVVILPLSDILP